MPSLSEAGIGLVIDATDPVWFQACTAESYVTLMCDRRIIVARARGS